MSLFPIKVTFYDGTFFANGKQFSVEGGQRDVTEFVTDLSWSFSTTAPFEGINMSLDVPLMAIPMVFPPPGDSTGDWSFSSGFGYLYARCTKRNGGGY